MSTDAEKSRLLTRIQAGLAAPEPGDEMLDLVLSLAEQDDDGEGLRVVWFHLWSAPSDWAPRVAAFALARCAGKVGDAIWPLVSTFLSSPAATDDSTLVNTASTLQIADSTSPLARAVLQVDLIGFVARCLGRTAFVRDAAADMVLALDDTGALRRVLVKADAAKLAISVRASVVKERKKALLDCLESSRFREHLSFDAAAVEAAATGLKSRSGTSAWAVATSEATEGVRAALYDVLASERLRGDASSIDGMVQQLHFGGKDLAEGRVGLSTLEQVLKGWHRLFQVAYDRAAQAKAGHRGKIKVPRIFALAPATGSFVMRLQVEHEAEDDIVQQAFEDSVKFAEGRVASTQLQADNDAVTAVASLHAALSRDDVDLTVDMTDTSLAVPRARARIFRPVTRRVLQATRGSVAEDGDHEELPGLLQGANHTTGKVEISSLDGAVVYHCNTPHSARSILVSKVIGKSYVFSLKKTVKTRQLGEDATTWTLLGIRSLDVVAATSAGTVPEFPPVTGSIPSDDIPQQDSLERIIQVVSLIAAGSLPTPERMGMAHATPKERENSERHINYMKQAARILGLLDATASLTSIGSALVMLPPAERLRLLAIQFQTTTVCRGWLHWAGKNEMRQLDPASSAAFLRERGHVSSGKRKGLPLTASMIQRRGRCLTNWAKDFQALPE